MLRRQVRVAERVQEQAGGHVTVEERLSVAAHWHVCGLQTAQYLRGICMRDVRAKQVGRLGCARMKKLKMRQKGKQNVSASSFM